MHKPERKEISDFTRDALYEIEGDKTGFSSVPQRTPDAIVTV
jgi:hypothetical protein